MTLENFKDARLMLVTVVYLSLFLDNVLLTVVVPIIPDYLSTVSENSSHLDSNQDAKIGFLLSSKAFVQLILNPAVGSFTGSVGYSKPLFIGNSCLLLASLLYAFGQTYEFLFLARSIQGISSACIGVSGMSLVASQYTEESERSKVMGFVLGSIALGVLVGYPIGSILYDIEGKMAPFLVVSTLTFLPICLQMLVGDSVSKGIMMEQSEGKTNWRKTLTQWKILTITGAIFLSTLPMATLEPCLPIWLRSYIKPKKWQLGTVFIPDSVGYLVGTNFFGVIAYRCGRCRTAVFAMCLLGVSTILLPSAKSISQLVVPHLGLGLGIGVIDAALVPLLASLVDQNGNYGTVYSIQQVAVSLAYSLGPIVGSELVQTIGFSGVMRTIGLLNLVYCPCLIYLAMVRNKQPLGNNEDNKRYNSTIITAPKYQIFQESDDDL
ncbi:synaptic vesicular amine transporter [Fopius arisanus]|uniref:Synaptic vesicular amine transporter n=1 Tax=Fopius arisanus TaxID=64838 RepID=A0A9R1TU61_9HYME|nr:PREDICTED: synaptic vesicular amine transporter [Fopius arisanus]